VKSAPAAPRAAGARAGGVPTIRRAAASDAASIAGIMRSAIRALPPGAHSPAALAAWSSLPALYHRWAMGPGGETYLVAERAGRRVGYAALRGRELTAVFVRPSASGRGVGAALVRAALRLARRRGERAVSVVAAASAVSFYERLGFRGGRPVSVPLPGGARLASRHLRLVVAAPATASAAGAWRPGRGRTARRGAARSSR
jgi:GNAT superfamily N-acetyltransferase